VLPDKDEPRMCGLVAGEPRLCFRTLFAASLVSLAPLLRSVILLSVGTVSGLAINTAATTDVAGVCTALRWIANPSLSRIAFTVTEGDVFKIEKRLLRVFTIKPWFFVLDGKVLARHRLVALVAYMPGIRKEFEQYVFDKPVACGAWIHSKLDLLFQ
jgi:hypothetical protein